MCDEQTSPVGTPAIGSDANVREREGDPGVMRFAAEGSQKLRMAPKDPWQHRSSGMRCQTCMFYVPKEAPGPSLEIGRCRRHAPAMNGYPVVFLSDWCGDHKLDENKI